MSTSIEPTEPEPAPPPAGMCARLTDRLRYVPGVSVEDLEPGERRASMRQVIVAWCFGTVFFTGVTSAPLVGMFRQLGASMFLIGILAAIPPAAMILQPLASWFVMRKGSRKRFFLRASYPGRLVWIPLVLIGWFFPPGTATVLAMFALMLYSRVTMELASPAWFSWVSDIVPERERGWFWSTRQVWGTIFGTLAALALTYYIGEAPTYGRFVIFFIAITFFGWADIFIHRGVVGVKMPPATDREAGRSLAGSIARPLRDPAFRPILLFTLLFSFSHQLGGSMYMLLLLEEIRLSYFEITLYNSGLLGVLMIVFSRFWGRIMDAHREGERLAFVASAVLVSIVAIPYVFMGVRDHVTYGLTIVVSGVGWAGFQIAMTGLIVAWSPRRERVTYAAVHAATTGIGYTVGAIVAGAIAEAFAGVSGHWGPFPLSPLRILYWCSSVGRLLSLLVLPMIRLSGSPPLGAYVRELFQGNLFSQDAWARVRTDVSPSQGPNRPAPVVVDPPSGDDVRPGGAP